MKPIIFAVLLLTLFASFVGAEQVWPQPRELYSAQNIEFGGKGLKTSSGNYLVSWKDTREPQLKQQFLLTHPDGDSLWQRSIPLRISGEDAMLRWMIETGGDYLLLFSRGNGFLHGFRLSASGEHVWPETGIQLLHSNLINPEIFSKLISDGNGGYIHLWAWTFSGINNPAAYYFQHMDAQGETAIINGPVSNEHILVSDPVLSGPPDLFMLADGGLICAYRENDNARVRRMGPNHLFIYTHDIPIGAPVWPHLVDTGDGCFNLIWNTEDAIMALRYNYDFSLQWPMALDLCQATSGLTASNCISVRGPGSKTLTVWKSGNQLKMQRFTTAGVLECGSYGTTIMDGVSESASFELKPDQSGGCFIIVTDQTNHIASAQYITPQNQVLPQPVLLALSLPGVHVGPGFDSAALDDGLHFYHQISAPGFGAIRQTRVDSSGAIIQPGDLDDLVSGHSGKALSPLAVAANSRIFTAWMDEPGYPVSYAGSRQIHYQWVNRDGSVVLNEPATIFEANDLRPVLEIKAIKTDTENVLICWWEGYSPPRLKAQLIDSSGNQLWEPGGRLIADEGLQSLGAYGYIGLTQAHGAVFILWMKQHLGPAGLTIHLQKVVANQIAWEYDGRWFTNIEHQNNQLIGVEQNYLFTGPAIPGQDIYQWADVWSFDAEGGFLNSHYIGSNIAIRSFKLGADRLYVTYGLRVTIPESYYYLSYGQAFSLTLEPLWGPDGIDNFEGNCLLTDNNDLYLARGYQQATLHGFDPSGQEFCGFNVPSDPPGAQYLQVLQLQKSWEDRFVGLARSSASYGGTRLYYFSFDATGWNALDSDFLLAEGAPLRTAELCRLYDDAYALWGTSATFSDTDLRNLRIQRINSHLVDNDDPIAPELPKPTLSHAYPNPFTGSVSFTVTLPQRTRAEITIYNLRGQLTRHLHSGSLEKGKSSFEWDGRDERGASVANGIYLCKARLGNQSRTIRLVKLR